MLYCCKNCTQKLKIYYAYASLNKTMVHHKNQSQLQTRLTPLIAASVVVVSIILAPAIARADQFEAQIKALEEQRSQNQGSSKIGRASCRERV